MVFKSISVFMYVYLAVVSFNVTAAPVELDWKNPGDGLITYDANTGLEWLDFTLTDGLSYDTVYYHLDGIFEGWRFATYAELRTLWESYGGDGVAYDSLSSAATSANVQQNREASNLFFEQMGDPYCIYNTCDETSISSRRVEVYVNYVEGERMDDVSTLYRFSRVGLDQDQYWYHEYGMMYASSGLVRVSSVPIPAAIWLFGSGLIGLIGLARRKA